MNRTDDTNGLRSMEDVLRSMNAVKHPDTSRQMQDSKERIFRKISGRIQQDMLSHPEPSRPVRLLRAALPAAAVIALVFISAAAFLYLKNEASGGAAARMKHTETVWEAPRGALSRITLPDGSLVTLNGGSRLTYPAPFGRIRQVTLEGEGFFDVSKDADRPFLVHTGRLSVKVLGTRFGLRAYGEDAHTTLTLEEGSLGAAPDGSGENDLILLKPDQQLVMDNRTGAMQRREVNAHDYTAWKDGILVFRDLTLGEIALVLERRFNARIRIASDSIRSERYAARFKDGESIEQIVEKLSHKRAWKCVKRHGVMEFVKR
jgi:ferric-dicitrate binding protein FerR (iron transport regulator)